MAIVVDICVGCADLTRFFRVTIVSMSSFATKAIELNARQPTTKAIILACVIISLQIALIGVGIAFSRLWNPRNPARNVAEILVVRLSDVAPRSRFFNSHDA